MRVSYLITLVSVFIQAICARAAPSAAPRSIDGAVTPTPVSRAFENMANSILSSILEVISPSSNNELSPDAANTVYMSKGTTTGGDVKAPQILYSVTVSNPGDKPAKVTVEYTDASGKSQTETADVAAGESHYFGQKTKKEKYWTSNLVVTSVTVECDGEKYTLPSSKFGMQTTTDHLTVKVGGNTSTKKDGTLSLSVS